jgi:hypothetical protein
MYLPRVVICICLLIAVRLCAAPAILFQLDQTPVTGNFAITNGANTNSAFWGTLKNSGALPALTNGASANTGSAWQFNGGYHLGVGPDAVTKTLGDITNTLGLSIAFWVRYTNSSTFVRVCGLGGNGETFDFSTQSGGKILWRAGYQASLNAGWVNMSPNNVVFDNNWHHIVGAVDFRRNVNNAVMFVDGVPVLTNSATLFGNFTNTGTLSIGARGNGSPTACAMDQFMVFTNALQAAEVAQMYSLGGATNYAPVVSVSASQTSLPWTNGATSVQTTLAANIKDDGLPNPPARVTNLWTQISGPTNGTAFTSPTNATTTVTFTNTGVYVLRCTARDGALSDYDEVTVNVFSNAAPIVAAWTSSTILLSTNPTTLTLAGWVTDDGQPNPPNLTTTLWARVSSPGNVAVTFGNPTNINTTVTIPTNIGTYVLRLTANDTLASGTADVTINVVSNLAPVLSAWTVAPIAQWPSNQFNLLATISDDGRPAAVTNLWSKISGPGSVTFANAATTNTTATCSLPGIYQLRIVASDSALSVTNDVWVNIWSNSPGVLPPGSVRQLTATPPPYVHPRIFFTDADRASLQARAVSDAAVSNAIYGAGGLTNLVATTVDNPQDPLGMIFPQLALGDTTVDISALVTNGVAVANVCMTGDGGLWENLASACYLAWLYPTNSTRLQQLATAVATAATIEKNWYVPNPADELDADVNADLGFCYDLMYNWMSPAQQAATRGLISNMTTNRHTIGWNQTDYTDSTNWRTHHDHLLIAQLSIEGETGYDAVALTTNSASLKTFTTRWGITEQGFSREGTDYFSFGMRNAALAALALARRGENYFVTTRVYDALQESFYMMAPWGVAQFGHDDGAGWGNNQTGIGIYFRVMKFMYPTDELADCVLRNFQASPANDVTPLATAIFGVAPLSANTNFAVTAAARNLNLVKFDPQRGLGVVRSDWGSNSAQIDFDCRFDTMSLGHLHSDRNNFDFFSHQRTWIGDPGYHVTENDAHSTILIDGVGEAGMSQTSNYHWPSLPARWVDYVSQTAATFFAGDASPAYDYSWDWASLGDGNGYNPLTSYTSGGLTTPWRWVDLMYAPPSDLSGANAWMTNYVRAESPVFNPVQRAFRTVLMQRGTSPYALIVDDIQKDNSPHTYAWSANTIGVATNNSFADPQTDVSFVSAPDATNAVLWHTNDTGAFQPRLLVRVLDGKGTTTPIQIVDENNNQGTHVRRLVISRSNVAAPDFKVLLFPHLSGATMPTTAWSNNVVTVTMADGQTDRIYFNTNADGRTRIATFRIAGQGAVAVIPTLTATAGLSQVTLNWSASSGATGYVLKFSTNNGATYSLLASNVVTTNFTHANLAAGTNYFYTVATLNTNGVSEDSAPASAVPFSLPPSITGIQISGGNLVVTGTNGTAGANYLVLTTTNLALPVASWSTIATQQFQNGGAVNFTNPLNPNSPQTFFRLRLP